MAKLPLRLDADAAAVRTHELTRRFGRTMAVDHIDLTVPEGAVYLLIGPNGAGKTTTFRMLLGLLRPTSGSAEICGVRTGPDGRARAFMGVVPETHDMPWGAIKVRHLVAHHASYFPSWDEAYARRLIEKLEIRMDTSYVKLSKGQARRVQLLLALAPRPRVLLLDEPTDGLDPVARDAVQGVLAEHIAESPTTLLIATHLVYEMERLADHVGVLRNGRLVTQVPRNELQARLRRYVLDVPEQWKPAFSAQLPLVAQNGTPREQRWTVWGEEREITQVLERSGATVRAVNALSLDEAAIALLSAKEV